MAKSLTQTELDAIRARAEAATEGPWREEPATIYLTYNSSLEAFSAKIEDGWVVAYTENKKDAEFIAAARQDVPRLLEHIDSKDEIIAQLWNVLGRANDLLDDAYDLLEDSVYHGHPTTDDIAEYLNVKGERGE